MVLRTDTSSFSLSDAADRDARIAAFSDFEILATDEVSVDAVADASNRVNQATGMVAVQLDGTIIDAAAALRAHATTQGRSLESVAEDVVGRHLSFPIGGLETKRNKQVRHVEDWYAENSSRTDASSGADPIDADRWLYVHRNEVVGASSTAAVALIRESGMVAHIDQDRASALAPPEWDTGRISLLIGDDGRVRSAHWG
ncbi:hypothetical protein [Amnibacterium sp.]|uniref:hypothetical protein n=1 Tax=Amnibacterium sp. TaxID=1872496 RepID=UPI00261896F9|nr:hypothetical protein [Amnibacterium sp.]MCU1472021.1 hypothetical protein [Amnibacterium sp.]